MVSSHELWGGRCGAALAELEARYNGPIPRAALEFALSQRSAGEVALLAARARAIGSRLFVEGQLRAIRRRRADGSAYPALLEDFRSYWLSYRAAMRRVAECRAVVAEERRANLLALVRPLTAEAAE